MASFDLPIPPSRQILRLLLFYSITYSRLSLAAMIRLRSCYHWFGGGCGNNLSRDMFVLDLFFLFLKL